MDKYTLPVPKTTQGLRDALFDEMNLLRAGKTTQEKTQLLCRLATQIIDSIRVQIQFEKISTKPANAPIKIQLGSK